jgi:hypothetical protein
LTKERVMSEAIRHIRVSLLRALSAKFPGIPHTELGLAIQAQEDLEELLRWYEFLAVSVDLDKFRAVLRGLDRAQQPSGQPGAGWLGRAFFDNQRQFPAEQLDAYVGQHIAWSWDGSRILAGAPDEAELRRKLVAAGHDPCHVVYDYVEDGRTSHAG